MGDSPKLSWSDTDLPALFSDFDSTSRQAQARYLGLLRYDLVFLVVGACASSVNLDRSTWQAAVHLAGAVSLLVGLVLTAVIAKRNLERIWYGARAGAESVKSLSWKYMMQARPFGPGVAEDAADALFTANLREILHSKRELGLSATPAGAIEPITTSMRVVRHAPSIDRRGLYLKARVEDQWSWYSGRSQENASKESVWFTAVLVIQAVAVLAALGQVMKPDFPVNIASILAAAASSGLAWLQVKRHQELSQSYALAAHELALITAAAAGVDSDAKLADFVNDAETAISREHTMWVARREGGG